jgi:hypothetical protein
LSFLSFFLSCFLGDFGYSFLGLEVAVYWISSSYIFILSSVKSISLGPVGKGSDTYSYSIDANLFVFFVFLSIL